MANTTEFLKNLGDPNEIKQADKPLDTLPANTHIHLPPNFSAFNSVEQAVEKAASEGIKVLGCGNYYDFTVYDKFVELVKSNNIFPVFGTEIIALEKQFQADGIRINDPGNPGKFYICGKAIAKFENFTPKATELVDYIRTSDAKRMAQMAQKMGQHFKSNGIDIALDADEIIAKLAAKCNCPTETITLQERHLTQAYQQVLFEKMPAADRAETLTKIYYTEPAADINDPVAVQNEMRSMLLKAGKPCFVDEEFVSLSQAQTLICQLGGIPCYPVLADGSKVRCEYEQTPETLIEKLKSNNINMAEFIPNRNSQAVMTEYVKEIRAAGIAVVAGTEHNTLDLIDILPACKDGDVPPQAAEIFWEGTCVSIAHQFMIANGQPGYVDENGNLNNQYKNADETIKAFAKIGSEVLRRYLK